MGCKLLAVVFSLNIITFGLCFAYWRWLSKSEERARLHAADKLERN